MAGLFVPLAQPAQAAVPPVVRDGSSADRAAASCWEINQNWPSKPAGAYWLLTPAMAAPQQFFCDGGWVLVGRGREGWTANYNGQGDPNALLTRTRKPDQFVPVQLPATTIDGLMNGGRVDAMPDGIMLYRATTWNGSAFNTIKFSMERDRWAWSFGASFPLTWSTYDNSGQYWGGRSDNFGINDAGYRAITDPLPKNSYLGGWAFGGQSAGGPSSSAYIWSPTDGATNGLPYSEVYIRPHISSPTFSTIADSGTASTTNRPVASSYALPGQWGVTTPFPGGTLGEGNNPVQRFVQNGNTMFVGGNFTRVQQGANGTSVAQAGLAAFNATTGEYIPGFKPVFNNTVRALVMLPNGVLLAGGDFTMVNGQPVAGLVALDPNTGATVSTISVKMENRLSPGVVRVRDLELAGDMVYVSGQFTHMGTSTAMTYTRNAGRISWSTGKVDTNWNPEFSGTVYDGDVSEDGSVFWAAGWFDKSKGTPTFRAAAVSTAAGAALALNSSTKFVRETWSYPEVSNEYQQSVQQAGNRVYFGGAEHALFGFDISTLNRVSGAITMAGGDFQALTVSNGVIYGGCHCNNYTYENAFHYDPKKYSGWTQGDSISWLGAWDAATGKYIPSFNPLYLRSSNAGAWALYTATDGTIWAGGDFTGARTSRTASQWVGGFVRFPETDSVAPSTPTRFSQVAVSDTTVSLSWQGSSGSTYEVLRDDRVVASTTATSITLPRGGNDRFFVRAVDAAGNRSASTSVLVVNPGLASATELVGRGATWSYFYDVAGGPAAGWNQPGFDVSGWSSGAAPLGWGGSGIVTSLDRPVAERGLAMYFSTSVQIPDASALGPVTATFVADDGAVVYVNGVEVGRVRMPAGAVSSSTYASSSIGYVAANAELVTVTVPAELLVDGVNTVTAETHLNYRSAPSASFFLSMQAQPQQ